MIRKILAAIDGSEPAWKALDLAADIAKQQGARLIVLHVVPFEPVSDSLREFAAAEGLAVEEEAARFRYARTLGDSLTRSAEARSRDKGLTDIVGRTAEGRPADQILEAARDERVDMIVMGTHGRSGIARALLGSVAAIVVRRAACPVLTVPEMIARRTQTDAPRVEREGAVELESGTERVIAIGGSADGFKALGTVLEALPRNFPGAVVVAQHRARHAPPVLANLLKSRTSLAVKEAIECRPMPETAIRGKQRPLRFYEVLSTRDVAATA